MSRKISTLDLMILGVLRIKPNQYPNNINTILKNAGVRELGLRHDSTSFFSKIKILEDRGAVVSIVENTRHSKNTKHYYITDLGEIYYDEKMKELSNTDIITFLKITTIMINIEKEDKDDKKMYFSNLKKYINRNKQKLSQELLNATDKYIIFENWLNDCLYNLT